MPELDLEAIVGAVRRNCHLSDAQHAGDLTLCTFLLKMRELYRWEQSIPLTRDMGKAEVGDWMNARGIEWDSLEGADYLPIPLPGGAVDPFESARINAELVNHGYVYSGGYGRGCKPHFFLAELDHQETRQGFSVYVSGRELARDLDAPPGMYLDRTVFIRTEALRRWLWEKYEEWRWSKKNPAIGRAFAAYAFAEDPEAALDAMVVVERESVLLHELGEARVAEALGPAWDALLVEVMRGRAEIILRAARDLYADSLSTLPGLIERGDPAAIHFWFGNLVGMRRKLAPELAEAYAAWHAMGDLQDLAGIVAEGASRWRDGLADLMERHATMGPEIGPWLEASVAAGVWLPLGAPVQSA